MAQISLQKHLSYVVMASVSWIVLGFGAYLQPDAPGVSALDISPAGNQYATGHSDRTVRIWDTTTGQLIKTFQGPEVDEASGTLAAITVVYSHDGDKLAVSFAGSQRVGLVWVLDTNTGRLLAAFDADEYVGSLAWSPDGISLAGATNYGIGLAEEYFVKVWNVETQTLETTFELFGGGLAFLDWHQDGQMLAGSSGSRVIVWDTETWEEIYNLEGDETAVTSVKWNPDGSKFASAGASAFVHIFDTATGHLISTLQRNSTSEGIQVIAWSPDGTHIGSAQGTEIQVWNVITGASVFVADTGEFINEMVWLSAAEILYGAITLPTAQTVELSNLISTPTSQSAR